MFLFSNNESKIIYSLKASILSFSITIPIAFITAAFIVLPDEGPDIGFSFADAFGLILFSPIVETLLMIPMIILISTFSKNIMVIAGITALIWSLLHSSAYPLWGVFTFVPFIIFSVGFQVWKKESTLSGGITAFLIHALHNCYVIFSVVLFK